MIFDQLLPYQREALEARAVILAEIDALAQICGINAAITKFQTMISDGTLRQEMAEAVKKPMVAAEIRSKYPEQPFLIGAKLSKMLEPLLRLQQKKCLKQNGQIGVIRS